MKHSGANNGLAPVATETDTLCRPLLLVVSAPSGGGKTTLCRLLMQAAPRMRYSVSCTTRAPRGDEQNGRAYHFLTPQQFRERIARGDFIEYAEVHDHLYGTLRADVEKILDAGDDVLLDIDVQGARILRRTVAQLPARHVLRRGYVDVFIAPPSLEVLAGRLRDRGEDSEDVIAQRLENARTEMAAAGEYGYRIVNDVLDKAAATLCAIVVAEHHRNVYARRER